MTQITVNLDFDTTSSNIPEDVYIKLMQTMFNGQHGVARVELGAFSEGRHGLSSLTIMLARSFNKDNTEYNPVVVRCGPLALISKEKNAYDNYVKALINSQHTPDCRLSEVGDVGAIGYRLLQIPGGDQPLLTLYDALMSTADATADQDMLTYINYAISRLFTEVLYRDNNAWYSDSCVYDAQRPLWFYNSVLPPILTLDDVHPSAEPVEVSPDGMRQAFYLADQKNSHQLHGQLIMIGGNETFTRMEVVERSIAVDNPEFCSLYLYVFEHQPAPFNIEHNRQPLLPIAARIKLHGKTSDLYDLPAQLDRVTLTGIIMQTRFALLHDQYERYLGIVKESKHHIELRDPLQHYFQILSAPQTISTSIIHGDMNLRNILLQQFKTGDKQYTPLVIDFDKTQPGGHVVFDAVKLETEYKIHILSRTLKNIDELITLEKVLYKALTEPAEIRNPFGDNLALRDAYGFITNIRRMVLQDFVPSEGNASEYGHNKTSSEESTKAISKITPAEYYTGLLAYGLATLKYSNLYDDKGATQGLPVPLITPLSAMSYVSASFAVSAIEKCRELEVPEGIFPSLEPIDVRWVQAPRLVGRDSVIVSALQQFRSDTPVVVLYGRAGSGREAVVRAICARLQRRGYAILPLSLIDTRPATFDDLLAELKVALESYGIDVRQLRRIRSTSSIDITGHQRAVKVATNRLIKILEEQPTPFVLVVQVDHADNELREQIATISRSLRGTAMIVVGDYHITMAGIAEELPALSSADITLYLDQQGIAPNENLVRWLEIISNGLGGLLHSVVQRIRPSLGGLIENQEFYGHKSIEDFVRHHVEELRSDVKILVEIAALLSTYGHYDHKDLYELLNRYSNKSAGSNDLKIFTHQYINHDSLTQRIYTFALQEFARTPEYRERCRELATYYSRDDNLFLQARYYSLAGDWHKSANLLIMFLKYPDRMFKDGCEKILNLTEEVLQHPIDEYIIQLHDLAGTCATFIGRYEDAIQHLEVVRTSTPLKSPAYQRLCIRVMVIATELRRNDLVREEAEALLRVAGDTPLEGIARGYLGVSAIGIDNVAAQRDIEAGIALMKGEDRWSHEDYALYEGVLFHLRELGGQTLFQLGQYDTAVRVLEELYDAVQQTSTDRHLIAKLDSVLGICYSYRGRPGDHSAALTRFRRALVVRTESGDYGGQFHTLQNMAILLTDIARTNYDWREAATYHQRLLTVMDRIQHEDPMRPLINQIDLAIREGDFQHAHSLIDRILTRPITIAMTRMEFDCNRAKLALEEHDIDQFNAMMRSIEDAFRKEADPNVNRQFEWIQLAAEGQIRLGVPVSGAAAQLFASVVRDRIPDNSLDDAWAALVRGMWAVKEGDTRRALDELQQSSQRWLESKYIYLGAWPLVWIARIERTSGDPNAELTAARAKQLLEPFGEQLPLLRLLDQPLNFEKRS